MNQLKVFDSSYYIGQSHFEEDGKQNYLVFQPVIWHFRLVTSTDNILPWKSKGLSAETITVPNHMIIVLFQN